VSSGLAFEGGSDGVELEQEIELRRAMEAVATARRRCHPVGSRHRTTCFELKARSVRPRCGCQSCSR
jgi:hypothetical protein